MESGAAACVYLSRDWRTTVEINLVRQGTSHRSCCTCARCEKVNTLVQERIKVPLSKMSFGLLFKNPGDTVILKGTEYRITRTEIFVRF